MGTITQSIANNLTTGLGGASGVNFRNIIINGDMSIAQRGTSDTGLTTFGYRTVDRFNFGIYDSGTWTITQDTDVPTGQGFAKSTKLDCTTANGSLEVDSELRFFQKIEGQNLQYLKKGTANAESVTLSFWVKSNKTGTYTAEIFDADNARQISKSYTISSSNTWEKKTLTFSGDTTGAFDNDNARSLDINFWLGAGTDFTSGTLSTSWSSSTDANRAVGQVNLADSTDNNFWITGVQLEAGTTASDFEFLPVDVNLGRCLRYFEKFVDYSTVPADAANSPTTGGANGWIAFDVNNIRTPPISFKCEKRTAPTIVLYRGGNSTAGNMGWFNGSSWQNAGTSVPKITTKGFYGTYNSSSSFTQFNSYLMDFSWTADSEL
jgi:hypothetical protein